MYVLNSMSNAFPCLTTLKTIHQVKHEKARLLNILINDGTLPD